MMMKHSITTWIIKIKSNLLQFFLSALGLSSVCFIFEACYGVPMNMSQIKLDEVAISGEVVDENTNLGITDIQVILESTYDYQSFVTDSTGSFDITLDLLNGEELRVRTFDNDGVQNGEYHDIDSFINYNVENNPNFELKIDLELDEK